jgi:putative intracellular protease/amidase
MIVTKLRLRTRKQKVLFSAGAAIAMLVVILLVFAPGRQPGFTAAAPINKEEQMQTIKEIGQPRHRRPVVAIVAFNKATEVTDLTIPYSILKRADVADVAVVAQQMTPISLYPFSKLGQGPELFRVDPQATMQSFDKQYPDGADYIVIPALEPRNDKVVVDWINAQHRKGANVVSVCAGALTLAATGLLDGRQATTHWAYVDELKKAHPTTKIVPDHRYVSDKGVTSATGISASIPTAVALVEAIGGQEKASQVAQAIGITYWDARHRSSDFDLTWEHKKTFLRNGFTFWRRDTIGVPIEEGVDEMALALTADAYSRTLLSKAVTIGSKGGPVRSKYGLTIYPNTTDTKDVDSLLPAPSSDAPAQTIDKTLKQIAERYGRPTAEIVALTLEYPWTTKVG